MKQWWQRLTSRVNAMSLRERFLLFAAVVLILAALTHELFIAPLTRLQRQRADQIEQSSAAMESQVSRIEAELAERRRARLAELNAELARLQSEVEAVDRETAALGAEAADASALRAVVSRTLRNAEKVSLIRVTTSEAPVAAATPATPGVVSPRIGVDITLGGAYLDLMEYFAALEAALPQARWSALRFTAETAPQQATVRILAPRGQP